jgi:hypothetical protein
MMACNQKISNLLNVVETKLKDLETQLELARARTETIEAHVETIKALMKIEEAREKERAREKEIREKKPEILGTITDDTCAPWEGSYVTGLNDHMVRGFALKINEIREKEAREKEFLKKEAVLEKEASEKRLARAALEIAEAREKEARAPQKEFLETIRMKNRESLESNETVKTKLKKAELHSCDDDDDTYASCQDSYVTGQTDAFNEYPYFKKYPSNADDDTPYVTGSNDDDTYAGIEGETNFHV